MTRLLEVAGLEMRFGQVTAADGFDLAVDAGELVGIIGPNGAGKTTFVNLVTGYLRPLGGSIRLEGDEVTGRRPHEIVRLGVARSFQIPQLFLSLSVLENVLVALAAAEGRSLAPWRPLRERQRLEAAQAALARFGLAADADRAAGELPEGGRKLLDVVLAFALGPRLLLLDEPTSGVSAAEKHTIMATVVEALRERSITALFIEHDMDVVRRFADRVLVLSEGRCVADGTPEAILSDPEVRRAVAGRV